jgi:hypothetical protein
LTQVLDRCLAAIGSTLECEEKAKDHCTFEENLHQIRNKKGNSDDAERILGAE